MLWHCPDLHAAWKCLKLSFTPPIDTSHIREWLVQMINATDPSTISLLVIIYWAMWYRRNKLIHQGKNSSLHDLVCFVKGYLQELQLVQANMNPSRPMVKELWRPPDMGSLKLNFDATFHLQTNSSTDAVIVRNSDGQVMSACTYPLSDVADAFVTKARACEQALIFTSAMGFRRIVVEGDSRTVINKIQTIGEDRSILRALTSNFKRLERFMDAVSYRFVHKEVNKATHILAKEGRQWPEPWYWIEEASTPVERVVSYDCHAWVRRISTDLSS